MALRIKNNTEESRSWAGQTIAPGEYYSVDNFEIKTWRTSSSVIQSISLGELIVNDGVNDLLDVGQAVSLLSGLSPREVVLPTFASKSIGEKKLYSRITGKLFPLSVGMNVLDFLIPFNSMKMNGLEIVNAKAGETVSLKVLDTATGAITTFPNYLLNQFGFDVVMPDGFYSQKSNYDADVIKDLVIRLEYTAKEARDLGVNYLIHELK